MTPHAMQLFSGFELLFDGRESAPSTTRANDDLIPACFKAPPLERQGWDVVKKYSTFISLYLSMSMFAVVGGCVFMCVCVFDSNTSTLILTVFLSAAKQSLTHVHLSPFKPSSLSIQTQLACVGA